MPARSPFTMLCQLAARGPKAGRADLHLHTTCSDGTYTPAQVVDLARRCGLSAVAITDHDTLGACAAARTAAAGTGVEVITGVEITSEFRQRELHLLAYFVALDDPALSAALEHVRHHRRERFREMTERLRQCGVAIDLPSNGPGPEALGRRYLAELLVGAGRVATVREAFARWLGDGGRAEVPKVRLPVAEALALVRGAGGVASWAHPNGQCDRPSLVELRAVGLGAVEVEHPVVKPSHKRQLREWAGELGLAVTGGSDCHGPGRRGVGCCTVAAADVERLRSMIKCKSLNQLSSTARPV
jgi:3',5'-nucleoside bisphosphate phosphatase